MKAPFLEEMKDLVDKKWGNLVQKSMYIGEYVNTDVFFPQEIH